MGTFHEKLELLIDANSRGAVSEINKTTAATEGLSGAQKLQAGASNAASKYLGQFGVSADMAGGALATAGVAAGALTAVKVAEWAKGAADETSHLASEIRDFQRASGTSAEDASRFVATLDDLTVSQEAGVKAAVKLNREIANGGPVLDQYGIAIATNKDGTTDFTGTLENVADAYVAAKDPAEKLAIATAIFGKSGKDLIPILEQGSKGIKELFAGVDRREILTQDQLDKAKAYDLAMNNLNDAMRDFKIEIGNAVIPIITEFANGLTDALLIIDKVSEGLGKIGKFSSVIDAVTSSLTGFKGSDVLGGIFDAVEKNIPVIGQLKAVGDAVGGVADLFGIGGEETKKYADTQKTLADAQQKVLDLQVQNKQGTKEYADAVKDANAASKAQTDTVTAVNQALTDQHTLLLQARDDQLGAANASIAFQQAQLGVNDALDKEVKLYLEGQQPTQTAAQYQNDLAQAHLGTETAVLAVVSAAEKKAEADAGPNATAADIAKAKLDAQNQAIINLTNSTPASIQALHDLGFAVITLPGGKQIVITVETEQAIANINALDARLEQFRNIPGIGAIIDINKKAGGALIFGPQSVGTGDGPSALAVLPGPELVGPHAMAVDAEPTAGSFGINTLGSGFSPGGALAAVAAMNVYISVNTTGLGADAPEIQRAVVAAMRGYVQRNGRLEGIAR